LDLLNDDFNKPNSAEINKLIKAIPRDFLSDTEKAKWIFNWCLENLGISAKYIRVKRDLCKFINRYIHRLGGRF
jgi:hypothetical protein